MTQGLPLTVKRSIELIGLVLLAFAINQGQQILIPILMAAFAAIALLPFYRFLVRIKLPNSIAIVLSILLMLIVIALVVIFITYQLKPLINNYASIKLNITNHINYLSQWFIDKTNISSAQQTKIINKQTSIFLDSAGNYLSTAAGSVSLVLMFFGLLPIYTFLILFYKDVLIQFLFMWFQKDEKEQVGLALKGTVSIIQSYIVGLLIQFTYMTILLGGALLLFGIKYALLIAIIFAILNLIPYVGALVGNFIGVLLTLSSSPSLGPVFTVLICIGVVQLLDNNILMPAIVGSKIKINALVSLFGVFMGAALAGIPGMFLSLPLMAVLKVIFDHTEQFKKWGVLFGDEKPSSKAYMKVRNWHK